MEMKQTAIINDSAAKSSSSSAARQSVPQSSPLHELPFRPLDRLHSTAGNRATGRWLQAKLKIGSANDSYEQEADRVAAVVVGTSSIPATEVSSGTPSLMQRKSNAEEVETQEPNTAPISNNSHQGKCACEEDEFHLQRKLSDASPLVDQGPSVLMQRQRAGDQEVVSAGGECEDDREAIIHRKETLPAKSDDAPAIVHKVIRSAGQPLEPSLRTFFETRLNTNLEGVRVHTDSQAARSAEAVNARAYTVGEHVVFGQSQFSPESGSGKLLLAHELTHVLQQGNRGSPSIQRDPTGDQQTKIASPKDDNPIYNWVHPASAVILIQADDKLYIAPAERFVLVPPASAQQRAEDTPGHLPTDLGTLFAVPAAGASGTRVFQAGNQTALLLDAGSDPGIGARVNPTLPTPTAGQAAIYTAQFSALMANLGVSKVSQARVIHGHLDHVGGIPAVVEAWGTISQNVIIPQEYQNLSSVRQTITALRSTTDPNLTSRGFGNAWNPVFKLKDKGTPGSDVFRHSFLTGELVVEMVGLRSALKGVQSRAGLADTASLMTRVTRRTDGAKAVVLGDLRGQDLEQIKTAMEAESAGSWNQFFAGAPTLSGFSHHVGRLDAADVTGIMSVLDATLLQSGSLRIVEQTNPTARGTGQARVETLELLSHLGINVAYTTMPAAGAPPSSVTATKTTIAAAGPQAAINPIVQSTLTTGLERLRKLVEMQETVELWRPWLEEIGGAPAVESLLNDIHSSASTLRGTLRTAADSAVRVRTEARATGATGSRDYTSTGGTQAEAYQDALKAIPPTTALEGKITPEFTRSLEQLRSTPSEEIPLRVAVHQAMQKGVYSDKAFSYLLGQLNPTTRDSLIYGKRGGLVPRNVAFQRVRAQVEFERKVIPGETWSVSHWGSAPARTVGVSVNLLMLAIELWNDIGKPLLEAHRTSVQIKEATQIVPFLRRVIFWQTMGAQCLYTGVNDPTFGSPSYITNPEEINKQINDLDGLFMQSPGLTDGDILRVAAWLTYNVRNYDEFAVLFIDSKQDAVRWEMGAGDSWDNAKWKIKTGYYETSGSNHVEEKWEDSPKLTQFMQKLTSLIISNTSILLGEFGTGKPTPEEMTRRIGALPIDGPPKYRARLRVKSDSTPARVPVIAESGTSGPALKVTLKWWSEPEFYVLEERETSLMVTGADYNTYALIRKQESEHRTLHIGGYDGYTWTARSRIGNEGGAVWIAKDLLERTPEVAANTPAAQPNSGTAATPTNLPAPTTPSVPVQSITGKDVAPRKGGVEFGPQTFQKPGPDAGKDDTTLPGAKIRF